MMPKYLRTILKGAVSGGIVYYLFSKVSLGLARSVLQDVRLDYIIAAAIFYFLAQMLSAYKWGLIAGLLGFERSYGDFFSYYFIGMFFNLFMLGSIGGDVVRAFYLSSSRKDLLSAGYSVFLDRFTGGLALVTILCLASLFEMRKGVFPFFIFLLIALGTCIVWAVTLLLPRILEALSFLKRLAWKLGFERLKIFWDDPSIIVRPLLISLIFQAAFVFIIFTVGKGFGINVPLRYFFLFVPISDLLSILPITVNGLGLREGVYVFFLDRLGVDTSLAVMFSFLSTAVVWAVSLIGGGFYMVKDRELFKSLKKGGFDGRKDEHTAFGP